MKRYDYIFDAIAAAATIAQTRDIFQIVSLIVTIISVIASLSLTLYKWYKTAKADGHITPDEVADAVKKTADAIEDIRDAVDGVKGDDKK